ncbi:MAG: phage major capsid protein [Rikenellaceae bacterium]
MSGKLKKLKEDRSSIYTEIDNLRKQTDGRDMTVEERASWDKMIADHAAADTKVSDEERFLEIQRKQISARANVQATKNDDSQYRSAFTEYLVRGESGVSSESRAILESREGISGLAKGVITPSSIASEIEIALKEYGGMFEAGTLFTTSHGGDMTLPTINNTSSKATIIAEYGQSSITPPAIGSQVIKAYTYRTPIVPLSLELLQDSAFQIEAVIANLLADSFYRGANEHLTTGTGTNQPKGLITCAVDSGVAAAESALTFDNVMDLVSSVDNAYGKNGKFMLNQTTLYALAKIKDTDGQYLWRDSLSSSIGATLLGKNYIINNDVSGIGEGNTSLLFGDLSKYKIRLVKDINILRLNELLAEWLSIGIMGFARLDGMLLDAGTNPVKKIVHATS